MFLEGLMFGIATYLSVIFTWWSLPAKIKRWTFKAPLVSDLAVSVLAWMFITSIAKSTVAAIATIITTILWELTLRGGIAFGDDIEKVYSRFRRK